MKPFLNIIGLAGLLTFSSFGYFLPGEPEIAVANRLFTIERSRDSDYLVYELNLDQDERPKKTDPINISWIIKSDNNRKAPLTLIQNQFGYGIDVQKKNSGDEEVWLFSIVAVPGKTFTLKKDLDRNFHVYLGLSDGEMEIERLYINFLNNSFWHPKVSHVTIYGIGTQSGDRLTEIITL